MFLLVFNSITKKLLVFLLVMIINELMVMWGGSEYGTGSGTLAKMLNRNRRRIDPELWLQLLKVLQMLCFYCLVFIY